MSRPGAGRVSGSGEVAAFGNVEVTAATMRVGRASLVAQLVKNPPAVRETWVRSLRWEDPLEKGKATHSSIPAWRIPWTEEPGRLQSMGSQRVGHDLATLIIIYGSERSKSLVTVS